MKKSMSRMIFSSFTFWLVVAGLCIYSVLPLNKKLKRGIDLVGGTYMTLEVETEKAVDAELLTVMQSIPEKLEKAGKPLPKAKEIKNQKIILTFADVSQASEVAIQLQGMRDINVTPSGQQITLQYTEKRAEQIKKNAVTSNREVYRARLGELMSTAEINIAPKGERGIIIELPGVTDPMKARAMIGKSAILEFKLVERTAASEDDILYEYDGEIPYDMEILKGKDKEGEDKFYLVPRYTDLTGKDLKNAQSGLGGDIGTEHVINFEFSSEGGKKFYELTSRNVGRQVAVILDDVVLMAPVIKTALRTSGVITGGFSSEQAKQLATLLRSGALVAPVKIEGEQQIGPTLGAASIKQGLISCLVGLGLLLLFSLLYYGLSGLFAFIALMFNLCLVLFGLYATGSVLTLPGIAGMVLTVGMAIDASILIYERIKDGLKEGVSIKNAVDKGFSNAMVVILDANITTMIVGIVLYKFGTGPLQGFAVTMMLGIVSTLITGLLFLKSIFTFMLTNFRVQKLRI